MQWLCIRGIDTRLWGSVAAMDAEPGVLGVVLRLEVAERFGGLSGGSRLGSGPELLPRAANATFQGCFRDLLLTVQHLQLAIKKIHTEVQKEDEEYKISATTTDYDKTHAELKINITKMREQLMTTKLKKFERDTRDYLNNKVYTWAEDQRNRRPLFKRREAASSNESGTTDESEQGYNTKTKGGKYTKNKPAEKPFLGDPDDRATSSGEQSERQLRSKTKYVKKPA